MTDRFRCNAVIHWFFHKTPTQQLFLNNSFNQLDLEQFIQVVDAYIRWYNEKRIKISLGSLSPLEYRASLGLTA